MKPVDRPSVFNRSWDTHCTTTVLVYPRPVKPHLLFPVQGKPLPVPAVPVLEKTPLKPQLFVAARVKRPGFSRVGADTNTQHFGAPLHRMHACSCSALVILRTIIAQFRSMEGVPKSTSSSLLSGGKAASCGAAHHAPLHDKHARALGHLTAQSAPDALPPAADAAPFAASLGATFSSICALVARLDKKVDAILVSQASRHPVD